MSDEYWEETVAIALSEEGISATKEQIENIAASVRVSHENYGMARGNDCIPNPLSHENQELRRELEAERKKVTCYVCDGKGHLTTYGWVRSSSSICYKCRGEGRI